MNKNSNSNNFYKRNKDLNKINNDNKLINNNENAYPVCFTSNAFYRVNSTDNNNFSNIRTESIDNINNSNSNIDTKIKIIKNFQLVIIIS